TDPLRAEVAAIEPGGQRRAGVAAHVDLVRRTWKSVVETTSDSRGHWETTPVDTTVASCDVTTAAAAVPCTLAPPQAGYYLVHATAKDEKGRAVSASYDVYVLGDSGDVAWRMGDSGEVELVTDKKSYQVGDVARVLVKSPFHEADALVTVERSGIYKQQHVRLVGPTPTISVPVTDDMRPNVFVAVELVRGRTKAPPAKGADVGAPAYKTGYARIVVDPESRRLRVAVATSKKDLRPGETVDVDVAVTDRAGKPSQAELTLWAVDEGVLMLTGYRTPDPLPAFTGPRPLAVFGLESRADLARFFRPDVGQVGTDKGDQGGGGGEPMRADFRATAWFQPGVVTGEDGRAHARFKLPDNLTTFRVMAVAVARDDRFGAGDAQVTSSRPLMLRPALPRFLRAGDAMDAGVVVTSKEKHDARVDVTLAADGLVVGGDTKRTVDVKAGQSVEVRWPMSAPRGGKAKLAFRARGGGESDAVEVTRSVDVPAVMEAVALDGETREAAAEKIGDLGAIRDDVGELDVRLASTALVGVGDGMDQLIDYPYGCTEQLTSRLVPLVAVRKLADDFGVSLGKDPDGMADAAIAKILANQRDDGGFGWWPDSRRSDPWVTAYALWGLDVAKKGGRRVPGEATDRATAWLRGELAKITSLDHVALSAAAFAADVLATEGKPDPGFTDRLYERRGDMPVFARALLAHAIATAKMDPRESAELLRDLDAHLRITPTQATVVENLGDEYAPMLDSEPRTTAMVLRALVATDPKHALLSKLA
ncbi:MAG TPA: alpha-2-macroglobulin family protein, partial [Polyangiaceae bacterium]|nr:alpha-2-macroglobulin family protein [Polyangiaceae bacterium]